MDIVNALGEKIGVMDQEDGLKILNYHSCDRESSEDLKKVRGWVQDAETGEILFETFPYTEEYESNETIPLLHDKDNILEEWQVYYSVEGCLIRVFWHKDRWHISTNKKLNAFKSRWASRKSFGDMFRDGLIQANDGNENVLEALLDVLDKQKVHLFLVRYNHENRVVCQPPKDADDHVYFIGSWDNNTKQLDREWKHVIHVHVPTPIHEVPTTIQDLADNVNIHTHQGVILFHKTRNLQLKVYSHEYNKLFKLRGNNPNIRFRYLEVRKDPDTKNEFVGLYPFYEDMFLEYENILYQLAKLIRYYYIQRYIKNKYVTLPKEEYILMKKCHDWYLLDRTSNKINVAKVLDILNHEEALAMYKMIRRYQINQDNFKYENNNNNMETIQYPSMRAPRPVMSMEQLLPDDE